MTTDDPGRPPPERDRPADGDVHDPGADTGMFRAFVERGEDDAALRPTPSDRAFRVITIVAAVGLAVVIFLLLLLRA
jgi:hypothetical protein